MAQKASKHEVDRRVHEISLMISAGKTTSYVCRHAKEEWGVSVGQAERYLARAREIIRADYSVERSDFLGSRLALLDKVIQKSIESGQHSNAVGALRLQAELTRMLDK